MPSAKRLAGGFYLVSRLQDELDWAIARAGEMTEEERPADLAPPLDVVETEDAVIVVVETPGLGAADLEVEAQGQRVVVRGRRTPDADLAGIFQRTGDRAFRQSGAGSARAFAQGF